MNTELKEAILALEKEKNISSETLFEAIENALMTACKSHFGKAENVKVEIDRESFDYACYAEKTVVETADDVMDDMLEISFPYIYSTRVLIPLIFECFKRCFSCIK